MEKMYIQSVEALSKVATSVRKAIERKEVRGATVIALHGDLGAGKTTFVQLFAKSLGVQETVTSPTFVIMKGYLLTEVAPDGKKTKPFSRLVHIDAYRIEDIDEMRVLGFEALLQQKDTIICIEWAEKIKSLLPEETIQVRFTIAGEEREVTISS